MLIIPAIDLKDGMVVRYVQGRYDKKVYSKDPVKAARHWVKQGAKFLHIVDLDGAFSGNSKNLAIVKKIAKSISIPVEFGGGVRSLKAIKDILGSGIYRVVLGTKAVENSVFLEKAFSRFGDKVIVGIDAKEGKVMTRGWKKGHKNVEALSFALKLKKLGFKEFIYTDTLKDGTLSGPNIKEVKAVLKSSGLNIIVSGGISKLEDVSRLKQLERNGVSAVIIGKALYEGLFTLPQALKYS